MAHGRDESSSPCCLTCVRTVKLRAQLSLAEKKKKLHPHPTLCVNKEALTNSPCRQVIFDMRETARRTFSIERRYVGTQRAGTCHMLGPVAILTQVNFGSCRLVLALRGKCLV